MNIFELQEENCWNIFISSRLDVFHVAYQHWKKSDWSFCGVATAALPLERCVTRVRVELLRWQESPANAKGSHQIGPHLGLPSSINVIYTSLKSTFSALQFPRWHCGSIFIRLAVVAAQTCQLAQNSAKIWTYCSSGSSKVDDFGTNRKGICEFLLVINSNLGPILHRFWDTYCVFFIPLSYSAPPLPIFPLEC